LTVESLYNESQEVRYRSYVNSCLVLQHQNYGAVAKFSLGFDADNFCPQRWKNR